VASPRTARAAGATPRNVAIPPDTNVIQGFGVVRQNAQHRFGLFPPLRMVSLAPSMITDALAVIAIGYVLVADWRLRRFRGHVAVGEPFAPPVTVLKPLCGGEPLLEETLRSFFAQDYPDYEIVFGVRDPDDPARVVVERLMAEFPERHARLVADPRVRGANPKVSNLLNMLEAARQGVLVLADSDILVSPDYLARVVAPLADRRVGAVTCLYRARPAVRGFGARLACLHINHWFLPGVIVAREAGHTGFCMGSTIALRRDALAAIGGFAAIKDTLADDHRIGRMLADRGYRVVLSGCVVETVIAETDVWSVLRRELRWARTIRSVQPAAYAASSLQFTMSVCLIAAASLALTDGDLVQAGAIVAAGAGARYMLHRNVKKRLRVVGANAGTVAVRDLLSFAVWAASFFGRDVVWRERLLTVDRSGNLMTKG
jgi:ceramide glucosyltransferase